MTQKSRTKLAVASLVLGILACNMPLQFEQLPPPDAVQTAAALTVQAALVTPSRTATELASSTPRTPSPTTSPNESTPTGSTETVPMLTVLESTNCRTGPGENYEVVLVYLAGKQLEIVGRYEPGNFWLVRANESPAGTCWISGEFAEVTGNTGSVPSVTPPATATSAPPRAAVIVEWNFFCSGALNFTVTWRDTTTDETGFRIFRNGEAVAELPPNTTTFTDVYDISENESVEYYVQVFSPTGTANTSIMRMRCGG